MQNSVIKNPAVAGCGQSLSKEQAKVISALSSFAVSNSTLPDGMLYRNRLIAYDIADHCTWGFEKLKDSDFIMVLHQLLCQLHHADGNAMLVSKAMGRFIESVSGKAAAASFRNFVAECGVKPDYDFYQVVQELTDILTEFDHYFKAN